MEPTRKRDAGRKGKGKCAWLITWEGPEAKFFRRPRIVGFLGPQFGVGSIEPILRLLYHAELDYPLDSKLFSISRGPDRYFIKDRNQPVNPKLLYGEVPKRYLLARQVKNARCTLSDRDPLEQTLHWTEMPVYRLRRDFDPNGRILSFDAMYEKVADEHDEHHTHSIRASEESLLHAMRHAKATERKTKGSVSEKWKRKGVRKGVSQ